MTINEIIKKAYDKYTCLQKEDFYPEIYPDKNLVVLCWHVYMDRFINLKKVKYVANFIRKYDKEVEITDSFGNKY